MIAGVRSALEVLGGETGSSRGEKRRNRLLFDINAQAQGTESYSVPTDFWFQEFPGLFVIPWFFGFLPDLQIQIGPCLI